MSHNILIWCQFMYLLVKSLLSLPLIDKLTKEEEEIYKLQHDLERTVISQQQSKKISEVSSHLFNTKQDT